jgi:plasmid rolling circle replication initiator protein Rep
LEIKFNAPCVVYINNNTQEQSCQVESTIDFHAEMQRLHKNNKRDLCNYYENKGDIAKAERVKACGDILTFKHYRDIGLTKLDNASLCRERLCLNCNLVASRKNAKELIAITQDKKLKHLVLSMKNCKAFLLRETLVNMKKAVKSFMRALKITDYYQSYEITYNKRTNEYHPHIHLLIIKDSLQIKKSMLNHKWAEHYNRISGTSYNWLSCRLQDVEENTKGCLELSKYVTKPQDFTQKTIPVFAKELKGLHLHQPNGYFKEALKRLREDIEKEAEFEKNYLKSFDYDIIRYMFDGDNYIKCE